MEKVRAGETAIESDDDVINYSYGEGKKYKINLKDEIYIYKKQNINPKGGSGMNLLKCRKGGVATPGGI